jgi:hypothetical protein
MFAMAPSACMQFRARIGNKIGRSMAKPNFRGNA